MKLIWPLQRGRVYAANLPQIGAPKFFVVVSNNRRNCSLDSVLAVRLTTSPKPKLASIIELGKSEVVIGRAVCDDIVELFEGEVSKDLGALSPAAMRRIDDGLRAALSL